MKIIIVYATNKICFNLEYFCKFAYFYDKDIDFYICLNNINLNIDNIIKPKDNLFIINKENNGYDFGAWSYVLLKNNLYMKYDYFILLNNTCIGPFLPTYVREKWPLLFINQLDEINKLVGPTINYHYKTPHVQSYFLCFDKIILYLAIKNEIFSLSINENYKGVNWDKQNFINKYEIGLSLLVLNSGYNIKCMMKGLENINFKLNRVEDNIKLPYGVITKYDMVSENKYFDISINPFEVIFFKSNRNINSSVLNKYIQFNNRIKDNSFNTLY